ncbi:glycoside hydrolase family 5 protein [Sphingomonas aracearum]|uniref:Glycoside hydrolase family 5 domain-containing protein n=1 Tax=Sphingomonas aracearum TaxID=2283317 RepID=A0A369VYV9_9SPHN|nr:cellulase family glycosylhydrolase [Sphingomonas aracearum]RDE06310.1 hypothetical protein DVW87_00840 [Sphingomonas aracearum]
MSGGKSTGAAPGLLALGMSRRRALAWLSGSTSLLLIGCGGSEAGSKGLDVVSGVGGASPTPSPTPSATATAAPSPTPSGAGPALSSRQLLRKGVSFSTIEGSADTLPGTLAGHVFVTPQSHFTYYAAKGFDHIRLEGSWERLQPRLFGPLGEQLLDHYSDAQNPLRNPVNLVRHYLDRAQAAGLKVLLDLCHNYGERYVGYNGNWANKRKAQLGSADVPFAAFADYCARLVTEFGAHPAVLGIELMNEPHDLAVGEAGWREACQQAINAIRKVNATLPIFIDGYGWASAEYWPSRNPTIHTLADPSDRLYWSAHQYFDANSSGIYGGGSEAAPSNAQLGVQRLQPFIDWLRQRGFSDRGHVGEFGAPDRPEWQPVMGNFIAKAAGAGLPLTIHQDVPYTNDPYTMNLFPQTNASGAIVGADRFAVTKLAAQAY